MKPFQLVELDPAGTPEWFAAFVELYQRSFTDPAEHEDPAGWTDLLREEPPEGQPRAFVLGAVDHGDRLLGGMIFELYRRSRCGLLTYLAVEPGCRRMGIGQRLIEASLTTLRRAADGDLRAVFSEVEDPDLVAASDPVTSPRDRLAFFAAMGARRVGIDYVQPELSGGGGRARHLWLLCYQSSLDDGLRRDDLLAFLTEFYRALGTRDPEADGDFRSMTANLTDPVPLRDILQ